MWGANYYSPPVGCELLFNSQKRLELEFAPHRCTPAMRLGFAKQPLDFEDIVWPGQRVPRPKRARRRGGRRLRLEGIARPEQHVKVPAGPQFETFVL